MRQHQLGEARTPFTQFCASALLWFVDNGFRTKVALEEEDPGAYQRVLGQRRQLGRGLLSKLGELVKLVAMQNEGA